MEAFQYDQELWFTQEWCDEKHFLLGNPHTFPGRMAGWCPKQQLGFCVSRSEMLTCSTATRYWVQGFLSGNEPGLPTNEEGDIIDDEDDPRVKKWRAAIELFATTGIWVVTDRHCEKCGEALLPSQVGMLCKQCFVEKPG